MSGSSLSLEDSLLEGIRMMEDESYIFRQEANVELGCLNTLDVYGSGWFQIRWSYK